MKKEVYIDISARHVHLSDRDREALFGEGYQLTKKKMLGPTNYSTEEQIAVISEKNSFPKVRMIEPARKRTQVEISRTDARTLGLNPPVRLSGDLDGTPGIKLVGPCGETDIDEGVIVVKRHLHLGPNYAEKYGISNGDNVWVRVDSDGRRLIFGDVEARVSKEDTDIVTMHIDTDEANAAGMPGPMWGYIVDIEDCDLSIIET